MVFIISTERATEDTMSMAKRKAGRPPKLQAAQLEVLREIAVKHPGDTLDDLIRRFSQRTGVTVVRATMAKSLKRAGVTRLNEDGDGVIDQEASAASQVKDPHRFAEVHRRPGPQGGYPSSLTDLEWELVRDLFETDGQGRPPKYPRRSMLDACCYVVRSGCAWRMLPKEFPKWQDVYATFRRWTEAKKFEVMNQRLAAMWREREGRNASPTAAIIDAQSVRGSPQGGPRGFDANKKIKGRKRHLVTDTLGLILAVIVTAASVQDRDAAKPVLDEARAKYGTIKKVFVDSGYAGQCAEQLRKTGVEVEVVRRTDYRGQWATEQLPLLALPPRGFTILPKRWVIERTNAWNDHPRRQSKDHDRLLEVSSSWIWLTQGRLLLRRLGARS